MVTTESTSGCPGSLIRATDLSFSYSRAGQEVKVLDNFTCAIGAPGEFMAVMGPSGSGKSTLLHTFGGLLKSNSGVLVVLGETLSGLDESGRTRFRRKQVGFVFQFFHLLPTLSAVENVMISSWMSDGQSARLNERWATELLERLGVGHRRHHLPFELSGGEVQRVAIARALFNRPRLIMADEPVGNLDRASRHEVLTLLREVSRSFETCVVMATHDVDARRYVDFTYGMSSTGLTPTRE